VFHAVPNPRSFIAALLGAAALLAALAGSAISPAASSAAACDAGATGGIALNTNNCKPIKKARLVNGYAVAPSSAPQKVKQVIAAANVIRNKKYIYGGGHTMSTKLQKGYDCSGSVSYALRAAGFIKFPMPSGSFINWKQRGAGRWITTYANGGHMYMVVAGLRFDTSGASARGGNRWTTEMRSSRGYSVRHPGAY